MASVGAAIAAATTAQVPIDLRPLIALLLQQVRLHNQRHPLGCGHDVEAAATPCDERPALVHTSIDLVIAALRLVMIEHELLHTCFERELHRFVVRRMTPSAEVVILLR